MIETKTLVTKMELGQDLRLPVLTHLEEDGWKPAILDSEKTFVRNAGVDDLHVIDNLRYSDEARYIRSSSGSYLGEIFFRGDDVFYMLLSDGRMTRRFRPLANDSGLEVGVISSTTENLSQRLQEFAEGVERAIKASVDGRKSRHLKFEWKQSQRPTNQFGNLLSEDSGAAFAPAALSEQDVKAARALASQPARQVLIELNQAVFVREVDLVRKWGKRRDEFDEAIETLKSNHLILTEYLIECKRSNAPLTRFQDKQQFENEGMKGLVCPTCGLSFAEEKLSEAYTVSPIGRSMSTKSHWMTVWVTDLLYQLGVPLDSIRWNISENGEEVDILMDFLGELWVFELKDREFGAGDAHPLNYRQVRFRASKAVVITTERVSPDAKRVFTELHREAGSRSRTVEPVYIEGLTKARDVLSKELARVSLGYASSLVSVIGMASGFNLRAILAARFGESIESVQDDIEGMVLPYFR